MMASVLSVKSSLDLISLMVSNVEQLVKLAEHLEGNTLERMEIVRHAQTTAKSPRTEKHVPLLLA